MRLSISTKDDYSKAVYDESERKAKAARDNAMFYGIALLVVAYVASLSPFALLTTLLQVVIGILAIICCGYGMIWHIIENGGNQ